MRWWNGFGRSVLFAALCAAACPLYLGFTTWIVGGPLAWATFAMAASSVYLLGLARRPAPGLAAAATVGVCGLLLAAFGATGAELVLVLAVLIGIFRSGLLFAGRARGLARAERTDFARRFAVEAALLGGGLMVAFELARTPALPEALTVWGFFLVQSGFFLVGGAGAAARSEVPPPAEADPFERACRRAAAVLDETP